MKRMLFLTTLNNTQSLKEACKSIKDTYGDIVTVKKIYLDEFEKPSVPVEPIEEEIDKADIVLIDVRGDTRVSRELPRLLEGRDKTVCVLVAGDQRIFRLIRMGGFKGEMIFRGKERKFDIHAYVKTKKFSEITKKLGNLLPFGVLKDMKNWVLAQQYYAEGGAENLKNMMLLLLKEYGGLKNIGKIKPPVESDYGLYDPEKKILTKDLKSYMKSCKFDRNKPSLAVLMYSGMHFDECRVIADSLYEELKEEANLFFIASKTEFNIEALEKYLNRIRVDLLLNCQYFRIHGGPYGGEPEPTFRILESIDVPVLTGLKSYATEIESWEKSREGLDPLEVLLGVTLPELDGCIEPLFVAGLKSFEDPHLGKIKVTETIDDRIKKLASRIRNWILLRKIPNSEKRVAIVTYNYPPGEENLANAGYLDVFESLKVFLKRLEREGYTVEAPDENLGDIFISHGVVNTPGYVNRTHLKLPLEEYLRYFEALPETVKKEVIEHWGEPPGNIMTDGKNFLIPGIIIGNVFVGIQPSRGVHEQPEMAYHDREIPPHHQYLAFYFYLREVFRANAIVHFGMHGTLEFTKGKEVALSSSCYPDILIGDIPHLYYYWVGNTSESTIAKRRSYALSISHASPPMTSSGLYEKYLVLEDLLNQYEESKSQDVLEMIMQTAEELHIKQTDISSIRRELYRMKRRLIPKGLHIMDRKMNGEELLEYLLAVLRIDREHPSIFKLICMQKGLDWEAVKDTGKYEELEEEAKKILENILNEKPPSWIKPEYVSYVKKIVSCAKNSRESDSLVRALDGRYIFPFRGGDPIRDPEVYPSGRAMYAFDPRLIPTVVADIRGRCAAELLVDSHVRKHGRYPETVGVVLWGFETMKTGGDTISLILSLIGVRLKHRVNPWFKDLELIPLEELKRPRIDVAITICGIFRDTLGTHIDLLDRAIKMAAEADEPEELNYVRKHTIAASQSLGEFSTARIFGPSPSEYATSMRTLVETGTWKEESELVQSYLDSMSYAYFNGKVEKSESAFRNILQTVELVTQERDTTEYEVTDLDHYYEFLGGLARTVEDARGTKAEVFVIDSTEEEVQVEDLKESIERASRTRLLNPKWIDGMLKHKYHGASKIKERVENLIGFAATTGKVENWIFDELANRIVLDEETRQKIQENNPYAAVKIAELLIEAHNRGYWKADSKKIEELRSTVLNMDGFLE